MWSVPRQTEAILAARPTIRALGDEMPSDDHDEPKGPDLTKGVPAADVPEGGMLSGQVGDETVVVARVDGELFAIGGSCTHYHGPLGEGLLVLAPCGAPGTAWAFLPAHRRGSGRAGRSIRSPSGSRKMRDGKIFVREAAEAKNPARKATGKGPRRILIAGAGAAGFAAAEMLRRHGHATVRSAWSAPTPTRPTTVPTARRTIWRARLPAEWMPLREDGWYKDHDIDLQLKTEITKFDLGARTVPRSQAGEALKRSTLWCLPWAPSRNGPPSPASTTPRSSPCARCRTPRPSRRPPMELPPRRHRRRQLHRPGGRGLSGSTSAWTSMSWRRKRSRWPASSATTSANGSAACTRRRASSSTSAARYRASRTASLASTRTRRSRPISSSRAWASTRARP